jgi:UPF0716 protein FxsA
MPAQAGLSRESRPPRPAPAALVDHVFGRLLLLFTLVPILELALLIRIGQWIGTWPTIAIILVTGLLGAWLAQHEGARAWKRVRDTVAAGGVPGEALLHGLLIFGGGAMLLTPGVLTDLLGLALMFPPTRLLLVRQVRRRIERQVMRSTGRIEARFWTHESEEGRPRDEL